MRQSHSISCDSAVWDSATIASQRHAQLELEIAALSMGQAATVIPIFSASRVETMMLCDSLLLIYETCRTNHRTPWLKNVMAVADALAAQKNFPKPWTPEKLYGLSMAWNGGPSCARLSVFHARDTISKLTELHRLMLRANRAHVEAKELMRHAATERLSLRCDRRKRMVA